MTHEQDWERLARYASGEADAHERSEVEQWAAESAVNRAVLDSVVRGWSAAPEGNSWDVDRSWNRLSTAIAAGGRERIAPALTVSRGKPWLRASRLVPLAVAASLLLVAGVRFIARGTGDTPVQLAAGAVFRTGAGEQRSFDLPDGSRIHLGASSQLRLDDRFGDGAREVHLQGQVFIRVEHDAARPFVVNAGGTRTTDLGTAFEVRAYPSEGVRVLVTEGSVEVQHSSGGVTPPALLQVGDVAEIMDGGAPVISRRQDVERLLGWTRGELTFDDAPLRDVSRELERWFDVESRIDVEQIADLHITVQLRIGESLPEILRLVELSLSSHGVRAELDGRVITFRKGAPVSPAHQPRAGGRAEVGA